MGFFDFQNLSTDDIATMALLADAAYEDVDAPDGWVTLTADALNYQGNDEDGYFDGPYFIAGEFTFFTAAARVMQNTADGTLAIAFRGTDTVVNYLLYPEILNSDVFVDNFSPLLDAVAAYARDPDNDVGDVWVTGHSLGAAAVNELEDQKLSSYGGAFDNATFVSFASPEMFKAATPIGREPVIFNVGFENDWVFKAIERTTPVSSAQPDFDTATNNLVWYDDSYASPYFAFPVFNPVFDTTAHSLNNYIAATERIPQSVFYDEMDRDSVVVLVATNKPVTDRNISNSDHFGKATHYLGRDGLRDNILGGTGDDSIEGFAGNDSLQGGAGDDIILAGSGDDTLNGNQGDDTLEGGAGNDILEGSSGIDVFRFGPDDIVDGDTDIVRGLTAEDSFEGLDTLQQAQLVLNEQELSVSITYEDGYRLIVDGDETSFEVARTLATTTNELGIPVPPGTPAAPGVGSDAGAPDGAPLLAALLAGIGALLSDEDGPGLAGLLVAGLVVATIGALVFEAELPGGSAATVPADAGQGEAPGFAGLFEGFDGVGAGDVGGEFVAGLIQGLAGAAGDLVSDWFDDFGQDAMPLA